MWLERIQHVEGYDAGFERAALPDDWKERIPFRHKEAAVQALAQVFPADARPDDSAEEGRKPRFSIGTEESVVILEAGRAGREYGRLVHRFRPPSTTEQKEYSRRTGQSTYVRGSRKKAKALVASNLSYLLDLYDELIEGVEGYEPNDPKVMDPLHKRAAVEVLFGKNF